MKIKLSAVLLTLFLANAAMAQFTIGVKAGANIFKVDGQSFKDEFDYGYHLGGFANFGIGGRFSLQPEVLFNQYQTKRDTSFSNIYQNVFSQFYQYKIELPVNSIAVELQTGFTDFIASRTYVQYFDGSEQKPVAERGRCVKKGDFSMLGGAQLSLGKIKLNGRYVVGLNNINDIDNQDEWKNQGRQLSLGLGL